MKLLDLYKAIADTANWVISAEGFVSKKVIGKENTEPVLVKKMRLAFPTPEMLKNKDARDVMIFHPLKEDVVKPETDILDTLRNSLNSRLNVTACWIGLALLTLAASDDEAQKMNMDQHDLLSKVKNVDQSVIDDFKKILDAMKLDSKTRTAVNVFLKKGGTIHDKTHPQDGEKFTALGIVKFPLYQELIESLESADKPEVFGVKLKSKKNRDILIALFKYMFPKIDTPFHYSFGSSSMIAAFSDALLQTTARIAAPMNQVVELFDNLLGDPEEMKIPCEWMPVFQNLGTMMNEIRMVPHQISNISELPDDMRANAEASDAKLKPALLDTSKPTAAPRYAVEEPGKPPMTEKGLDFAAMVKNASQPRPAFGFGQPAAPAFGAPAFGQQQHPAFAALSVGNQPVQNNPFAQFQHGNANAGRGAFGQASTGFGGGFGNTGGFGSGGRSF